LRLWKRHWRNQNPGMFKIGFGSDLHRLDVGRELVIGGVNIPSEFGAVGHSDADVLLHAVTDSILGALALGDIGSHFPDSDERWKDADSFVFLEEAVRLMNERGFMVANLDSIVHLEKPKLRFSIDAMRKNIADRIGVAIDCVSVKAKTGEGLDSVGKSRAVKAEACILLRKF